MLSKICKADHVVGVLFFLWEGAPVMLDDDPGNNAQGHAAFTFKANGDPTERHGWTLAIKRREINKNK